jgi:hypothetical protein
MKVHIWIDKNDVAKMAKGTSKILDFWYRKPSFPGKRHKDTVMVSVTAERFQQLLDSQEVDDMTETCPQEEAGFGD